MHQHFVVPPSAHNASVGVDLDAIGVGRTHARHCKPAVNNMTPLWRKVLESVCHQRLCQVLDKGWDGLAPGLPPPAPEPAARTGPSARQLPKLPAQWPSCAIRGNVRRGRVSLEDQRRVAMDV